jgi:hypothetical protein
MRTTISLDDDIEQKLRSEMRKSRRSFKETVNYFLRLGLNARKQNRASTRFEVSPKAMGLREGLAYDNIGDLLEQLEGPAHK